VHRQAAVVVLVVVVTAALVAVATGTAAAQSIEATSETPAAEVSQAIRRAVSLVEKSGAEYRRQRECFSCHHQSLPVLMLTEAQRRGFAVDKENLREQLDHTAAHLKRGLDNYRSGQGQGGRVDTAAWALWALEIGGRSADETTAAVAGYLLSNNASEAHWRSAGDRPPTQGSPFTTTYVAMRGLATFGVANQQSKIDERNAAVKKWLVAAEPKTTEDRVFRLRSLSYLDSGDSADKELVEAAAYDVLRLQRPDGGWAQTADLGSDAYATGTTLVALHETGRLPIADTAYREGVKFLFKTQLEDGSWRVTTRSKPIQKYFESGFPHEKDQFVSMAATNWATLALLFTVEKAGKKESFRGYNKLLALLTRPPRPRWANRSRACHPARNPFR
jgi:N-acyl-D-amino-acid deacylase